MAKLVAVARPNSRENKEYREPLLNNDIDMKQCKHEFRVKVTHMEYTQRYSDVKMIVAMNLKL